MVYSRPASAPVLRGDIEAARERLSQGERLLKVHDLLKEEHVHEIPSWWAALPVVGRARGRWVFIEPEGLSHPRQRARREILDVPSLDDLDLPDDEHVERHNKSQHFKALKGPGLHAWKEFCLKTTNQEFQKVKEPDPFFGPSVWFRMFRKSHGGILRPGALEVIQDWQRGSTERQRAALSELLWTFNDHLTKRRGNTETTTSYGPKQGEQAKINLIDPFASALGRPSSAPIAHAVQRKFEKQKHEAEAAMIARGRAARELARSRPGKNPFEKRQMDTLKSSIPLKMGATFKLESTAQSQMKTVTPKDLQMAIAWGVPGYACRPPASSGMGRHLGGPEWHGDAMYKRFWPAATKTFQPLDQMRRPHDIPGYPEERLKKYVS